ncbi:MAG: C26 family cysteine hydrolase domain-containing family [Nitrosopumilus sp.]|jgi:GMP synthase-like glutamine amidotransferase|nr:C26 family cysteine hydrolase domain-containing family [Nitrosopumilus sp.]MBT3686381.1 C26 family cysteine hydrolase domain-containing family [Nitrosopumilus sp.]MBT3924516.1 C26 family cysteine hydrolase domain-containing family [Nitrosopumilus sp.]MBT4216546.1 C26 family cysteine hydrolase domain-containing family [Nitrosopumilus sp.]MBT4550544.1 C26 family cysteine hydrolase domain-containing family [Nitrosopumilus sp.]
MSDVLLVQNTTSEGSGYLGKLLTDDGFDIVSINAKHEKIPENKFSLAVILGAPQSANDDLHYLREEEKLIQNYVQNEIPVLGICLGSQLIAKTFGATVYKGPKKEIGFYHDLLFSNHSKLFHGFKNPFTVFHWHGDTFDLPVGATRLALSENYPNQAFQYKSAIGLQFHLEVNEQMVNLWLDKTEEKLRETPYIDPLKIRLDVDEHISIVQSNMKIFYNNFKSVFGL